jgi:DNA-binding SARP family transcriptional activator
MQALERLASHSAGKGAHGEAIGYYERVLQMDSYRESACRGLMRSFALLGQRSDAVRAYQRLEELLDQELAAEPAAATAALYESILQGTFT